MAEATVMSAALADPAWARQNVHAAIAALMRKPRAMPFVRLAFSAEGQSTHVDRFIVHLPAHLALASRRIRIASYSFRVTNQPKGFVVRELPASH
jgi:hypothetical protein